jgi:hypothetical protein
MIVAKLLLFSLTVLAMSVVLLRYRQGRIGALGFLFWLALWIGAAVMVLFPDLTIAAAHIMGIGRGVDLVFYVSLILVFFLLFRTHVRLEQMDRHLTVMTRALALQEPQEVRSQKQDDAG